MRVVVTDDSPDGSVEEVVRRAEVPGMVYVRNAVRKGATGNWNEAVRHASGEYIKIMHHDDWFTDRDCLARFVEMLEEHPEADLAFCGSRQVMLDGVGNRTGEEFDRAISDEHLKMISEDWRDLYIGDYIGAPSATIYRKGAPEYEEKLTWIVDVEFYMRLLQRNPRFVVSKGATCQYRGQRESADGELSDGRKVKYFRVWICDAGVFPAFRRKNIGRSLFRSR